MNKRYDIIVVGMGRGGNCASALLAKRGLSVLAVDTCSRKYYYENSGFKFDIGSTLYSGFERGGLFDIILSEIGIGLPLLKNEDKVYYHSSSYMQIVNQAIRVNIGEELDDFTDYLQREFYSDAKAVKEIFEALFEIKKRLETGKKGVKYQGRIDYFGKKIAFLLNNFKYHNKNASKFVGEFTGNKNLVMVFDLLVRAYLTTGLKNISVTDLVNVISRLKRRLMSFGTSGDVVLQKIFKETILKNGGQIEPRKMTGLNIASGKVRSILLNAEEEIEADNFIFNIPLPGKYEGKLILYTFWTVKLESIPSEMKENVMTDFPTGDNETGGLWISLNCMDIETGGQENTGMQGIRTVIILKKNVFEKIGLIKIKEIILNKFCWLMPFAEDNLTYIGEILIDLDDYKYSVYSSEGLKTIAKNILIKNESAIASQINARVIPETFDPFISSETEYKEAIKISNELRKPKFSFVHNIDV